MLLKLSSYCLLIIFLIWLPDQFFSFWLQQITELRVKFRLIIEKFPYKSAVHSGEKLLLALSEFEGSINCGFLGQQKTLPQFKFYTNLILKLLEANRQEGIAIRKLIPELRIGVQKDIQFEKKINKVLIGSYFQFIVIALATWAFVFFSQQLVEIKLDLSIGILMASLQILGLLILAITTRYLKNKNFFTYEMAFQELYLFSALIEVRMPIKTILLESKIMNGVLLSSKHFSQLSKRIVYSVERWKNTGLSPKAEMEELIKEIWYSQDEQFIDFIKKLEILKFVIMALLFLPAYFLYLAAIFKFFMEQ